MSDRFNSLTVVLEKDIRDDDAEPIIEAIGMIKGVLSVKGNVTNPVDFVNQQRARTELIVKLLQILRDEDSP